MHRNIRQLDFSIPFCTQTVTVLNYQEHIQLYIYILQRIIYTILILFAQPVC